MNPLWVSRSPTSEAISVICSFGEAPAIRFETSANRVVQSASEWIVNGEAWKVRTVRSMTARSSAQVAGFGDGDETGTDPADDAVAVAAGAGATGAQAAATADRSS